MPISGFSTEQDQEVQVYRQMRAKYLAEKHGLEAAERAAKELPLKQSAGEKLRCMFARGRKRVSVGGRVVSGRKLAEDSDYEGEDDIEEGKMRLRVGMKEREREGRW